MRVDHNIVQNQDIVQNQSTNAVQNQGLSANIVQNQGGADSTDLVQLSGASSLVSLAKGMIPSEKQAQFEAISAQFQNGAYQADPDSMSQAIVQGHIGS